MTTSHLHRPVHPLTQALQRQISSYGEPKDSNDKPISQILTRIPRLFRPARNPGLADAWVAFNAAVVGPASDMELYRIPDGWSSLHVLGIDLSGHQPKGLVPTWYLNGGMKTIRKLNLFGQSACFNLRVPPWSCETVLGIHGHDIPDESENPASLGVNLPFAEMVQELTRHHSLDLALNAFEVLLGKQLCCHKVQRKTSEEYEALLSDAAFHAGELKGEISAEDLARALNVSPRHLRAVWNGHTPINLGSYLDTLRFWHALEILTRPEESLPLVQVAVMVGFADQSHMVRQFRRHLGMTPETFRRHLGQQVFIHGGILITRSGIVTVD